MVWCNTTIHYFGMGCAYMVDEEMIIWKMKNWRRLNMIKIEILTAPGCASCQQTADELEALVKDQQQRYSELSYEKIDISEHPEVAIKYRLLSTPAVAINGVLEFRGVPGKDKILEKIEALL